MWRNSGSIRLGRAVTLLPDTEAFGAETAFQKDDVVADIKFFVFAVFILVYLGMTFRQFSPRLVTDHMGIVKWPSELLHWLWAQERNHLTARERTTMPPPIAI